MTEPGPVEAYFSPVIRELAPYEPPEWEGLARRAGLDVAQLVRLDANENPYPLSPRAVEALARFDGYGFYPDYRALEQAVARYAGVGPENVVLGNGGGETEQGPAPPQESPATRSSPAAVSPLRSADRWPPRRRCGRPPAYRCG